MDSDGDGDSGDHSPPEMSEGGMPFGRGFDAPVIIIASIVVILFAVIILIVRP